MCDCYRFISSCVTGGDSPNLCPITRRELYPISPSVNRSIYLVFAVSIPLNLCCCPAVKLYLSTTLCSFSMPLTLRLSLSLYPPPPSLPLCQCICHSLCLKDPNLSLNLLSLRLNNSFHLIFPSPCPAEFLSLLLISRAGSACVSTASTFPLSFCPPLSTCHFSPDSSLINHWSPCPVEAFSYI